MHIHTKSKGQQLIVITVNSQTTEKSQSKYWSVIITRNTESMVVNTLCRIFRGSRETQDSGLLHTEIILWEYLLHSWYIFLGPLEAFHPSSMLLLQNADSCMCASIRIVLRVAERFMTGVEVPYTNSTTTRSAVYLGNYIINTLKSPLKKWAAVAGP